MLRPIPQGLSKLGIHEATAGKSEKETVKTRRITLLFQNVSCNLKILCIYQDLYIQSEKVCITISKEFKNIKVPIEQSYTGVGA